MTRENELWKICTEAYRKMYEEAEPPADFDEILQKATDGEVDDNFYLDHYLEAERQEEILDNILDDHSLHGKEARAVRTTVHLGCSPTTNKEDIE